MSENDELNFLKDYSNTNKNNKSINNNKQQSNIQQSQHLNKNYSQQSNFDNFSFETASKNILTQKTQRVDKDLEFNRSNFILI
jgi:hypothetical protein